MGWWKKENGADGDGLEEFGTIGVTVGEGEFKKISFTLPAIRALTGLVQGYDPAKGEYVRVAGATIEIFELDRRTTTDSEGRYLFRNMPPGVFTIRINEQQYGQVSIGAGPQVVRQDIKLNPDALASAERYRSNR